MTHAFKSTRLLIFTSPFDTLGTYNLNTYYTSASNFRVISSPPSRPHHTTSQSMHSSQIINIVRLDGIHTPSPTFSPSFKHTYTEYPSTTSDTETIVERIKDADVVITTRIPITEEILEQCPRLKHIAVLAIGLSPPSFPRNFGPQPLLPLPFSPLHSLRCSLLFIYKPKTNRN